MKLEGGSRGERVKTERGSVLCFVEVGVKQYHFLSKLYIAFSLYKNKFGFSSSREVLGSLILGVSC